jgi:hypothetical protein
LKTSSTLIKQVKDEPIGFGIGGAVSVKAPSWVRFAQFAQVAVSGLAENITEMPEGLHLRDDLKAELPCFSDEMPPLLFRQRLRVSDVWMSLVREAVVNLNDQCVELHQRQPLQKLFGKRKFVAQRGNEMPTTQFQVWIVPDFAWRKRNETFLATGEKQQLPQRLNAVENSPRRCPENKRASV